jgi:hypothetical protein
MGLEDRMNDENEVRTMFRIAVTMTRLDPSEKHEVRDYLFNIGSINARTDEIEGAETFLCNLKLRPDELIPLEENIITGWPTATVKMHPEDGSGS